MKFDLSKIEFNENDLRKELILPDRSTKDLQKNLQKKQGGILEMEV